MKKPWIYQGFNLVGMSGLEPPTPALEEPAVGRTLSLSSFAAQEHPDALLLSKAIASQCKVGFR